MGGALTLALGLAVGAAGPAHASVTFAPSGIVGGGFVNALTVAPPGSADPGVVLAGADISGIFQSTDNGLLWAPAKTGLTADLQQNVVALAWDTASTSDTAFALVGQNSNPGELLVSTDASDSDISWSVLDDTSRGMIEYSQGAQPRNTGRMIAQAGNELFVGSQNGLWECLISSLATNNCVQVTAFGTDDILSVVAGSTGAYLYVSAATAVSDPTEVYKYSISGGSAAPLTDGTTELSAATDLVPLTVGTYHYLYVADGNITGTAGGIYACNTATANSCTPVVSSLDTDNDWARIDGTVSGSTVYLYTVCAANPTCDGTNIETYSGTATSGSWMPFDTNTTNINGGTSGTSGATWWMSADNPASSLTGSTYSGGQIVVDPTDTSRIYLAGHAGIWEYGDVYGTDEWFPVPDGLSVTDEKAIAAEPYSTGNAEDAIVADSNWNAIVSDAHLQCCANPPPPPTSHYDQPTNDGPASPGASALSAAVEPDSTNSSNSYLFVGSGEQQGEGPGDGEVDYCQTDPSSGASCAHGGWTPLAAIPSPHNAVIGLAVGVPAGQTQLLIIAAVADEGIYFMNGLGGAWIPASGDIGITPSTPGVPLNGHIDIQFSDGSRYAYVWAPRYTPTGTSYFGLYQSTDIPSDVTGWNFNSGTGGMEESLYGSTTLSPDVVRANYMAGKPGVAPNHLYISSSYQAVQYATTGGGPTVMQLCTTVSCSSSTNIAEANGFFPGAVAVDQNGLPYLANNACGVTAVGASCAPYPADLYEGTSAAGTGTTAVGGASYQQQILFDSGIAVSGDGYIYVSSGTGGVAVAPPG